MQGPVRFVPRRQARIDDHVRVGGSAPTTGIRDYLPERFVIVGVKNVAAFLAVHAIVIPVGVPAACHFAKLLIGNFGTLGDGGLEVVVIQLLVDHDALLFLETGALACAST